MGATTDLYSHFGSEMAPRFSPAEQKLSNLLMSKMSRLRTSPCHLTMLQGP